MYEVFSVKLEESMRGSFVPSTTQHCVRCWLSMLTAVMLIWLFNAYVARRLVLWVLVKTLQIITILIWLQAPYFPKMHVELETEASQRSGKSSAVVPLTRTNSLNNPSDEAFVEHLRMLATNQTPPTIKHGHPTSTYGLQRSSGYSFHTGFPPPTPAGSTFPMYQARNSDPRTPMNRGNMLGSSSYQHVATPYSDGCKQNFSPPGMGMGMGRRLFQDPSTPSFGSPHRRSYDFDTPMYATPRKPGLLSPFRGFMSPSMTIHNSVEPDKIVAGEDVRTTVRSEEFCFEWDLLSFTGHASQHSKQGYSARAQVFFGHYKLWQVRLCLSSNWLLQQLQVCISSHKKRYMTDLDSVGYAFINFGDVSYSLLSFEILANSSQPMDIITVGSSPPLARFFADHICSSSMPVLVSASMSESLPLINVAGEILPRVIRFLKFRTQVSGESNLFVISSDNPLAIQGRDCLIQKFRNSSVMAEAEHCRPKVVLLSKCYCHCWCC